MREVSVNSFVFSVCILSLVLHKNAVMKSASLTSNGIHVCLSAFPTHLNYITPRSIGATCLIIIRFYTYQFGAHLEQLNCWLVYSYINVVHCTKIGRICERHCDQQDDKLWDYQSQSQHERMPTSHCLNFIS